MAKSLRSKWKRKMKQVKRERYGKKELERLKKVLETAKENDAKIASETDVTMGGDELFTVVTRSSRKRARNDQDDNQGVAGNQTEEKMELDQGKIKIFDPDTMQDQHGSLPIWVGSHKRKKLKKIAKKKSIMKKKLEKKNNKKRKNY